MPAIDRSLSDRTTIAGSREWKARILGGSSCSLIAQVRCYQISLAGLPYRQ